MSINIKLVREVMSGLDKQFEDLGVGQGIYYEDGYIDVDSVLEFFDDVRQMADEIEQLRSEKARLVRGIEVALDADETDSPFDVLHYVLKGEDYREGGNDNGNE